MHYREIDIFGVYVAPFVPLMLLAWLVCLPLFRLSSRYGWSRHVWHPSLFFFAVYVVVLCVLVLCAGVF
ncbi:DUF1656 domain-containing protein [Acetobacteraceae bacterium KSS8]|uniref:DUF1656 domain-containing protein n=1 Tax=Endosaccharibacter trunci TaxID=2812733 RepID=A0ABT1W9P6_9PROT|nr:DUF1656 domain-containing protein [Acetobacteraceae bacterium KSS8]